MWLLRHRCILSGLETLRSVLDTHAEVQSSVVVGVSDESDGQVPVAWVVAKSKAHGHQLPNPGNG